MLVHVLLYDPGRDTEGIHSLEISGSTVVLMFEDKEDAERYCGLLEAQDFPCPSVQKIDRQEIEVFCIQSGYEPRFVENGFIPKTEEERLSLVPPEQNRDISSWKDKDMNSQDKDNHQNDNDQLDIIRKRLEGLL